MEATFIPSAADDTLTHPPFSDTKSSAKFSPSDQNYPTERTLEIISNQETGSSGELSQTAASAFTAYMTFRKSALMLLNTGINKSPMIRFGKEDLPSIACSHQEPLS